CEGVFERFPTLKVVFIEGGFGWVPPLAWRLDAAWKKLKEEVPHLKRLPSEYIREHIWLTTQPMEEPQNPRHFVELLEQGPWLAAVRGTHARLPALGRARPVPLLAPGRGPALPLARLGVRPPNRPILVRPGLGAGANLRGGGRTGFGPGRGRAGARGPARHGGDAKRHLRGRHLHGLDRAAVRRGGDLSTGPRSRVTPASFPERSEG